MEQILTLVELIENVMAIKSHATKINYHAYLYHFSSTKRLLNRVHTRAYRSFENKKSTAIFIEARKVFIMVYL